MGTVLFRPLVPVHFVCIEHDRVETDTLRLIDKNIYSKILNVLKFSSL